MLRLIVDSIDMDPGQAFLETARGSDIKDPRIDGRFGRARPGVVYLESYSSADMGLTEGEPFDSIYVEASSRRAAVTKLLTALGYPRGTKFELTCERH